MGLNKSKGNMYPWITHTWNAIKGECHHDCSYCYMKRWGKLNIVRLDENEFKNSLPDGNDIFVGSSCDMWNDNIPTDWIERVCDFCSMSDNEYLFQTKNPKRIYELMYLLPPESYICTTIESNRHFTDIQNMSPLVEERAHYMGLIASEGLHTYVTIEPIMDFDLEEMVGLIRECQATQVNIGADSGNNNLPEPPKEKIFELITELETFTKVKQKSNLKRLLK